MRANRLVVATACSNGIIMLEGIDHNEVKIVGASIGNMPARTKASNCFSFGIEKGEKGMVALQVTYKVWTTERFHVANFSYFLGVTWEQEEEKPHLDLQSQWLPEDGSRLGHWVNEQIEVVVDGNVYCTPSSCASSHGARMVEDGNLLCRYMDSKISKQQFYEALNLTARERAGDEEPALPLTQIAILKQWKLAAERLKAAVEKQWFKRAAVSLALKLFPPE